MLACLTPMASCNRSRALDVVVTVFALLVVTAPSSRAQSPKKFEVASIRRADIPPNPFGVPVFPTTGGVGTSSPGRITYRGAWLGALIAEAFGVRWDQITGPAW